MPTFAYRGNDKFIAEVEARLLDAGFTREGEVEIADYVLVFCSSMPELEELYFGDDGIVSVMKAEGTIVDLSPATPNFAKESNAIATLSNIACVEAPLSVKDMAAEHAFERSNLSCFVAGEQSAIENARGVLEAIFSKIDIVGGAGAAQLARAAATLQRVAGVVAAIESNALFKASRRAVSSIEMHTVDLQATSPEAACVMQAVKEERYTGSFTCEMLYGELVSAIMAADDYELIMPQAEAASHLLELMAVIGGSDMSPAALALVYGSEEDCAKNGLDWSRAQAFYGGDADDMDEDDLSDGFGSFDDYDEYDDYSDDLYGEDSSVGYGYSAN